MEFTIANTVYRAGKLDAFKQLHIVRRLTPCIGPLVSLAAIDSEKFKVEKDAAGKIIKIDGDFNQVADPLVKAITALSDEDVEYVLNVCLEVTERKQSGGKWAPLRVNGVTMFDGLALPAMLQIAYHVILENLTDFFSGLPSLSGLEGFMKAKGLLG
ncbi:MAG: hypothetical protein FWG04_02605 [Desulfovibrionaceae bacterium]|nr:hypothetical protein [Desulfovibrionaceae bacterium]